MTIETESPADAGLSTEGQEQQVPQSTETPKVETAAPSDATSEKPQAQEPDYESLLAREDVIERLLQHPKAQQRLKTIRQADIDRQASEKADALLKQRDAEYAKQRETEKRIASLREELRLIDEDPTHPLAQQRRPQIVEELQRHENEGVRQRVSQELLPSLQQQAITYAGQQWLDMLTAMVQSDDSLSDEERADLNPRSEKFKTPQEFFVAWRKSTTSKEAQKLAKEMAKVESEAMLQERLGKERVKTPAPVSLPPGTTANTEQEFMAEYAAGKSNNTARQIQWMRENGIPV